MISFKKTIPHLRRSRKRLQPFSTIIPRRWRWLRKNEPENDQTNIKIENKKTKLNQKKARQGWDYGRTEDTTTKIKPRRGAIMVARDMQTYLSPIGTKLLNVKFYVFDFK